MSRKPEPPAEDYATIKITHHALALERAQGSRRRLRSLDGECIRIGHAWTEDPAREGGTICLMCHAVRWP